MIIKIRNSPYCGHRRIYSFSIMMRIINFSFFGTTEFCFEKVDSLELNDHLAPKNLPSQNFTLCSQSQRKYWNLSICSAKRCFIKKFLDKMLGKESLKKDSNQIIL